MGCSSFSDEKENEKPKILEERKEEVIKKDSEIKLKEKKEEKKEIKEVDKEKICEVDRKEKKEEEKKEIKKDEKKEDSKKENEKNEIKEEEKEKENEEEKKKLFLDSSKWREYIKDNNNFNHKISFDFKDISFKLTKASENPAKLNPFYTISSIFEFTKIFKKISSALSMGFSDITEKSELMRKRIEEYPEIESIQDLCYKEIELGIHKLNGNNNDSLGHKEDKYSEYISACRTFLRLLWFLEYLIDIFENVIKDDGNGEMKKILGDSYQKVLAPHHTFLVRNAVGIALAFSSAGSVAHVVEIIFGYREFKEETIKTINDINDLMKKIWKGGNDFYEKNDLLGLE